MFGVLEYLENISHLKFNSFQMINAHPYLTLSELVEISQSLLIKTEKHMCGVPTQITKSALAIPNQNFTHLYLLQLKKRKSTKLELVTHLLLLLDQIYKILIISNQIILKKFKIQSKRNNINNLIIHKFKDKTILKILRSIVMVLTIQTMI